MTNHQSPGAAPVGGPGGSSPGAAVDFQIGILDLLIVLASYKWLLVGLPLLAGIVAAMVSLRMTEIYTATARLLPPQQSQSSAAALLSQIGQLGAVVAPGAAALGQGRNPSEVYVSMLRSRTVADALIDRFHLWDAASGQRRSDARMALSAASQIRLERDGLISISVDDPDPKRAAAIANAYTEELDKFSGTLALTEASKRRLFTERQLIQAKDNLLKAELAARKALDEGGIAQVDVQGRTLVQTAASLRGRMAAKEVEINSMRGFATEQNPNLDKARHELTALREQVAKVEQGEAAAISKLGKGKDQGLKNVALLRELKFQEALFEALFRQFEAAKIDEARDSNVVQVMDKAIEPDRRSRPQRTLIVLLSAALSFAAAVVFAFLLEAVRRARHDPEGRRRLDQFRRQLVGWGPKRS